MCCFVNIDTKATQFPDLLVTFTVSPQKSIEILQAKSLYSHKEQLKAVSKSSFT